MRRNEKYIGLDSANGREGKDKTMERRGNGTVCVKDMTKGDSKEGKKDRGNYMYEYRSRVNELSNVAQQ